MRITGLARCTQKFPSKETLEGNKEYGPDKGWVLLSKDDIVNFAAGVGKNLVHRGRTGYEHVCAWHGGWAFDAQDSTYVRCTVFLHYRTPKQAAKLLGEVDSGSGAKVFKISGADLLSAYNALVEAGEDAHVWRRESHGEIAIDFCLYEGERTPLKEANPKLPTFVPG